VVWHVSYFMELCLRQRFASDVAVERAIARESETRRHVEAANAVKSEFLAVMSHELRAPLNAIIGFAKVLEKSARERDGPDGEHAARIRENGQHLFDLLTRVLDMSRAAAGELNVEEDEVELDAIARSSGSMHRPEAEKKGIEVSGPARSGEVAVWGDRRLLKQALKQPRWQCGEVH